MSDGVLAADWDEYLSVLRKDAHLLLAWGYADTRKVLPSTRDEYDITGLLADAMERRINDPITPERFMFYSVHNERPTSPAGQLGKRRPKLDIQIERTGIRPKRFYTFEAKRLRDDDKVSVSDSLSQYFGDDGIGRFVANRYEPETAEAAMLGCVQAHDPEFWLTRLESTCAEDVTSGRNKLTLIEQLQRLSVITELPYEASSIHQRLSGSKIRLLHIMLNCI